MKQTVSRQRITRALQTINELPIESIVLNELTGHIRCYNVVDGKSIDYWAGTGRIEGHPDVNGLGQYLKVLGVE